LKKLKSILLTVLFLTVILTLTGCSKKMQKEQSSDNQEEQQQVVQKKEEQAGDKKEEYSGNLEKMMSLGVPLKCSWKKDDNYYGESWVKGKHSYSEITMEGKTAKVIFKDDCLWNWQAETEKGIKICLDPKEIEQETGGVFSGLTDFDQMKPPADINYQCRPAVFTENKFQAPQGIEFIDLEKMMNMTGENE